jgi:CubicO group peptidase (beta-lactamase class C family)
LALLVEKLSGLEFRQYVHTYIFKPANMENTYFQGDPNRSGEKNKAINYEYPFLYSRTFQNVDSMKKYRWRLYNVSGFVGQGNVVSTTADMLKFDHALYSGKIVKAATLEEAFTPTKLNNGMNADADIGIGKASYGLGWFIFDDTSEGKIVWHTGGQPGGLSILVRNVTKKQFIMMFDNAFHKNLYADARNAMAILNNKQFVFHKKSLTRDYGSSLVAEGVDVSFCKLQQLRADSAHYYVSEDEMNELGLRLLYEATFDGHKTLALEVLKLNTLLFPSGYNTYDSYGEALSNVGKRDAAIVMYEKSIEINPKNEGGRKALEKLLKQ